MPLLLSSLFPCFIIYSTQHHRKKLQGRRLDFDCKRRRQARGECKNSQFPNSLSFMSLKINHTVDDEIRSAEEKFAESHTHAQMGMFHLLENDVSAFLMMINYF